MSEINVNAADCQEVGKRKFEVVVQGWSSLNAKPLCYTMTGMIDASAGETDFYAGLHSMVEVLRDTYSARVPFVHQMHVTIQPPEA